MLNEHKVFRAVRTYDPAIDWDAMGGIAGLLVWLRDGRPFDRLLFRQGSHPVVFHLRHVPLSLAHRAITPAPTLDQKRIRAFRAACVRVENLRAPGDIWEPARTRDEADRAGLSADLWTDAELDHLEDGQAVEEIGDVALALAFFPRATPPAFDLLPLSARILDTQEGRRRAVPAQRGAADGTHNAEPAGS